MDRYMAGFSSLGRVQPLAIAWQLQGMRQECIQPMCSLDFTQEVKLLPGKKMGKYTVY